MNLDTWTLFLLAYLLATLTPGPNVLLVIKNGLNSVGGQRCSP